MKRAPDARPRRPRRHSAVRTLVTIVVVAVFGLALVLFPLKKTRAVGNAPAPGAKPAALAKGSASASSSASGAAAAEDLGGLADAAPAASSPAPGDLKSIPLGKGLPVEVGAAVFFVEMGLFDDTKAEFECTTDLRLTWYDLRLAYPKTEAYRGYKEWRGQDAEDELAKMWQPNVEVMNRIEQTGYVGRRLRIFPNGRVETITRVTGKYKVKVDAERFPFDRQYLVLDLLVREETTDEVKLRFTNDDVQWSRVAKTAKLDGWKTGLVDLDADTIRGWNGDRYSRLTATLWVDRQATTGLAPIFIPLLASLLIPLLAIWMNRTDEEGYAVDAFELANMGIGGLFSVIALSFAIYSAYTQLAGGDNTVTRLFGLNYATLAISLGITVLLFRYNLAQRWWGRYVNEQIFKWITWAMPVLTLATCAAFLLVAAQ